MLLEVFAAWEPLNSGDDGSLLEAASIPSLLQSGAFGHAGQTTRQRVGVKHAGVLTIAHACVYNGSMNKPIGSDAVRKAAELAGGQLALAKAAGVKQGHIWAWINERPIPPEHCAAVSVAVDGQVTVAELRPDIARIFGDEETAA